MRVRDPHGGRWRVGRRWYLWRPQGMEVMRGPEIPTGAHDDEFDKWAGLALPRGNAGFAMTGLPVAAVEWLVLLLLMPVAVLARALGMRWTVVVRKGPYRYRETSVRGWAASRALVAETADAIEQGRPPERNTGAVPPDESRHAR